MQNFLKVKVLASSFHNIQPELKIAQQQVIRKKLRLRWMLSFSGLTLVISLAIARPTISINASRTKILIDLFVIPFAEFS